MIVLFVFFNGIYVFAVVSLIQDRVDVSVRDVSVRIYISHVLFQSSFHCLVGLLPYHAKTIGTIVSKCLNSSRESLSTLKDCIDLVFRLEVEDLLDLVSRGVFKLIKQSDLLLLGVIKILSQLLHVSLVKSRLQHLLSIVQVLQFSHLLLV